MHTNVDMFYQTSFSLFYWMSGTRDQVKVWSLWREW